MVVLYLLPFLFLAAAALWAVAIVLFGVVSAWQLGHDLVRPGPGARPVRMAAAVPAAAPEAPVHRLRFEEYLAAHHAMDAALLWMVAASAIAMWAIFLIIDATR